MHPLIWLIFVLIVVGIVLHFVPMDAQVKKYVLIAVGVLFAIVLLMVLYSLLVGWGGDGPGWPRSRGSIRID